MEPKDFLNKGPIVTVFAIQPKANLESAADQLENHLTNLNVPTVIVFGPRFKDHDRVCESLKNSKLKDRVS